MFEVIEIIENPLTEPLEVWFEPWGMPHMLAPGRRRSASWRSCQSASGAVILEVEQGESRRAVYAWPGSTMCVYCGDQLVDDFSIKFPELPPGTSTKSFIWIILVRSGPGRRGA